MIPTRLPFRPLWAALLLVFALAPSLALGAEAAPQEFIRATADEVLAVLDDRSPLMVDPEFMPLQEFIEREEAALREKLELQPPAPDPAWRTTAGRHSAVRRFWH